MENFPHKYPAPTQEHIVSPVEVGELDEERREELRRTLKDLGVRLKPSEVGVGGE